MSLPHHRHPSKTDPVTSSPISKTTRCVVLTGVGRSAVAVIAVEGHDAIRVVSTCFRGTSDLDLSSGQVRYGTWVGVGETNIAGESVVVTPLTDHEIEIHCHGGPAATQRIVADLQACGVILVGPDRWQPGDRSRLIREAQAILAGCLTARTAAIAMDQLRGAMLNWASSRLESVARGGVSPDTIRREAEAMLRLAPLGLRLTDPFRIVLIGPPNVGKSSLLNAIVGYDRSITFDGAGTTRDVLHAETVIDGWPVRLSDTAGIRESSEPIEQQGVVRARSAADQADLLLCVTEPALVDSIRGEPFALFEPTVAQKTPMIRLLNKADLRQDTAGSLNEPRSDTEGRESDREGFDLFTSALTGEGIDALMNMISRQLGQVIPEPGAPVPITQRQFESLCEISESVTGQQLEDALNSLLGFEPVSEEP